MAIRGSAAAAEPQERVLVIERIFEAPRELVFKCFTESERMEWMQPKGFTSRLIAYDFRPGGTFRLQMRGPDGGDHWQKGVFREIVPPERIVRTFCWTDADGIPTLPETLLTLTFTALGGKTRVTLHQAVFDSPYACDQHRDGWMSSLDGLDEYLATVQEAASATS